MIRSLTTILIGQVVYASDDCLRSWLRYVQAITNFTSLISSTSICNVKLGSFLYYFWNYRANFLQCWRLLSATQIWKPLGALNIIAIQSVRIFSTLKNLENIDKFQFAEALLKIYFYSRFFWRRSAETVRWRATCKQLLYSSQGIGLGSFGFVLAYAKTGF